MAKSLSEFWELNSHFAEPLQAIRTIVLDCGLEETFKWAFPTYTLKGKNVISIGSFKEHYAIWFIQGVFLADEANVLTNAQEGKTKAMRHWKFTTTDMLDMDLIRAYILEAIENSLAGKEVKVVRDTSYEMPKELMAELDNNPALKNAFYNLTPGRQKEYANYVANAKQDATKLKRIEKIVPMMLEGQGLNDRWK